MKVIVAISIMMIVLASAPGAIAGILADRVEQFPSWGTKLALSRARGDLSYPDWMEGNWQVTSTLIQQVAPLAPEIVTPGFEKNHRYLDQPVQFEVMFERKYSLPGIKSLVPSLLRDQLPVVANRAFNGLEIAKAYLGEDEELEVKVDPNNPNRQLTLLPGQEQLISTVTNRDTEKPQQNQFIATEITQQVFQGPSRIYLNEVETTSIYESIAPDRIDAQQITAIYLSPQDPEYFEAAGRPVALYRYKLELDKKDDLEQN